MLSVEWLSTTQVCARLGKSLGTVHRLIESGELAAIRTGSRPGTGHYRVRADVLNAYQAKREQEAAQREDYLFLRAQGEIREVAAQRAGANLTVTYLWEPARAANLREATC